MNLVNSIYNFNTPETYKDANKATVACGILNTAAATEMALRTVGNIFSLISNPSSYALGKAFSANLGGSLFYGMCAANPIPGSAAVGASLFSTYSLASGDMKNAYFLSKGIYKFIDFTAINIASPLFEHLLVPLAKRIAAVAGVVLQLSPLPSNPYWVGIAFLGSAFVIKKYVIPRVSHYWKPAPPVQPPEQKSKWPSLLPWKWKSTPEIPPQKVEEPPKTSIPSLVFRYLNIAAAVEMGSWATVAIIHSLQESPLSLKFISTNLAGSIFHGVSALNLIPGSSAFAAISFSIRSLLDEKAQKLYVSAHAIAKTLAPFLERILWPFCEDILVPVAEKVLEIASLILPLAWNPVWIGVVFLGTSIVVVKYAIPKVSELARTYLGSQSPVAG